MHAMMQNRSEAVTLLVARGAFLHHRCVTVAGANYGSIAALQAMMTSSRWLALSRTERLEAERDMLHYAKDKATLDAVRSFVLDMSAQVARIDETGNNALHSAANKGRPVPLICALIKEGVDPTHRNDAAQTPAEVASEAGHTLQATLLERAAEDKRRRDIAAAATTES